MRKPVNKKNMEVALQAAIANPIENLPRMASVIAMRGKVMSIGLNSHKTHTMQKRFAKNEKAICIHAEIAAIKNFLRFNNLDDLEKCSIYVARVNKKGLPALAAPCTGCERALRDFGISKVFWTEDQ